MAECIHLIEEATCTLCNGRDQREREREAQAARTVAYFLARYDGKCMECGEWFTVGTKVSRMQNGDLRHTNCTVRHRVGS